jgi:uncharacterized protein (TIGR02466 family)
VKIKVEVDNNVRLFWPTPVFHRVWSDSATLNVRLKKIILDREQNDPGTRKSVIGGWHSKEDFLAWPHPEVAQLKDRMIEGIDAVMLPTFGKKSDQYYLSGDIAAWANVLRRGGYHRNHSHPGCFWSGVYYVGVGATDPGRDNNGVIELYDPRGAVEMVTLPENPFGQVLTFPPEPGLMLIFPSWLRHGVTPYMGSGERITVAFNLHIESLSFK